MVQGGIITFLVRRAGLTFTSGARTGAVNLIQRFGSAPSSGTITSLPGRKAWFFVVSGRRLGGAWSTSSRPSVNRSGLTWSTRDCWCGISRTLTWNSNQQKPRPWTICWAIQSATGLPSVLTLALRHSRYRRFGTGKRSFNKLVLSRTEGRVYDRLK